MTSPRRSLSQTQLRILELLQQSPKPLSAYDLLGLLRHEGINAPPTVYRALDKLIREGLAHRIETLNGFVACRTPHAETSPAFLICDSCGLVSECVDVALANAAADLAARNGFRCDRAALELRGVCNGCRQEATAAA